MNANQELNQLENELVQILDNIKRVKKRIKSLENYIYNVREVGELKHRLTALKYTITKVCKNPTHKYK